MSRTVPIAAFAWGFLSGALLGWRWGREDGRRELAARIDRLARKARSAPR